MNSSPDSSTHARISASADATLSSLVTSITIGRNLAATSLSSAEAAAARASPLAAFRTPANTVNPLLASEKAACFPIPELAPVIKIPPLSRTGYTGTKYGMAMASSTGMATAAKHALRATIFRGSSLRLATLAGAPEPKTTKNWIKNRQGRKGARAHPPEIWKGDQKRIACAFRRDYRCLKSSSRCRRSRRRN